VNESDGDVRYRSDLDELLGISTASMDFDVSSVEGEAQFQTYMRAQQVPNDTDSRWCNLCQHQQEFTDLARMVRQYLTAPATSVSPKRFFSRVGLVRTDFRGRLLDTSMIDLMWAKQAPQIILEDINKEDTHTHHTHRDTTYSLTDAPIHVHFPLCLTHQHNRRTVQAVQLAAPLTLP
jgi:hypothetical protein